MVPADRGWRYAARIGALPGLGIILLRHRVPESPRRLMTHGRNDEAEGTVGDMERRVAHDPDILTPVTGKNERARPGHDAPGRDLARDRARAPEPVAARLVPRGGAGLLPPRHLVHPALALGIFHGVEPGRTGPCLVPFAIGNFMGPPLIGQLFDTVGRKPVVVPTYAIAGVLPAAGGGLFREGMLTATTQVLCWTAIFFTASSAASTAYLTVSEIFPLEICGMAIAVFYAAGAPMVLAAAIEPLVGVEAERESLESITRPLAAS